LCLGSNVKQTKIEMFERIRCIYAGTERLREIPKRDPNDPKLGFDEQKASRCRFQASLKKRDIRNASTETSRMTRTYAIEERLFQAMKRAKKKDRRARSKGRGSKGGRSKGGRGVGPMVGG